MASERKRTQPGHPAPRPGKAAPLVHPPGSAHRGFASTDPERQRETAAAGTSAPSIGSADDEGGTRRAAAPVAARKPPRAAPGPAAGGSGGAGT